MRQLTSGYINKLDPKILHRKAMHIAHNLKWGKGGTVRAEKMIIDVLGKPCHWCGKELTLDNITVDHKRPIKRPTVYTSRQFSILNGPKNLRIICQNCNFIKCEIPEKHFQKLVDFLNTDKKLKKIIWSKLFSASLRYTMHPYIPH